MNTAKAKWSRSLAHESGYWDSWLRSRGGQDGEQFLRLLDCSRPLNPEFGAYLAAQPGHQFRVLDVGAGPISVLGTRWEGRAIELIAVDPLADEYNASIDLHGIKPPVRTRRGEAERLSDLFDAQSFDLVHASNCIDHCYDPIQAIRSMLDVVKPGGSVVLEHAANEGLFEKYENLHQWNFDVQEENFVVWRPDLVVLVSQLCANTCETICKVGALSTGRKWLSVRMRKYEIGEQPRSVPAPHELSLPVLVSEPPLRHMIADRLQSQLESWPFVARAAKRFGRRILHSRSR